MENKEAISWFENRMKNITMPGARSMYAMAISALREQEERRWIPVTERLPQNYISVLVYLPGERPLPTVHEAYIGGDGNWHSSVVYGVENADVTHWMPMPEPQKEDDYGKETKGAS